MSQNPAPNPLSGQSFQKEKEALVRRIMASFRAVLPSNYVAQTNGPWYSLQFQAMAEQLADVQLSTSAIYHDSLFDFTRTDFLWQVLGGLIFPGNRDQTGIPQINGDTLYRTFLKKMVTCLLEGSTTNSLVNGLEALDSNVVVSILERYLESPPRDPSGKYTISDQFMLDVFVEGFPTDPVAYRRNAEIVLAALKPAHVLYTFSYLFQEAFEQIANDEGGLSLDLDAYHYDDLRKWCLGVQRIEGVGETLSNRSTFTDPGVSFASVQAGAWLEITSGVNAGRYRVTGTRALVGADPVARAYTLSTGGSGFVTALSEDTLQDDDRDWGLEPIDTQITILSGNNAGTYRLDVVLGELGGPLGQPVSGSRVRVSPSTLILAKRMATAAADQPYTVTVDRLGVQTPHVVAEEDVSLQFTL